MQRVEHRSRGSRRGEMACASSGMQPCGTGRCAAPPLRAVCLSPTDDARGPRVSHPCHLV